MKTCGQHNGSYACGKKPDHGGKHACYILGGKFEWSGPYDEGTIKRVTL